MSAVNEYLQLLSLLAIVMVMSPQRIDEAVHAQLLEKHGEKMTKMQRGYGASMIHHECIRSSNSLVTTLFFSHALVYKWQSSS